MTAETTPAPAPSKPSQKKTSGPRNNTRRPAVPIKRKSRDLPELSALRDWCASLNFLVKPIVHVNGPQFTTCVLTVDFGTPLAQERLTEDQQYDLAGLMVRATHDVLGREGQVGVENDLREGIWYTKARS